MKMVTKTTTKVATPELTPIVVKLPDIRYTMANVRIIGTRPLLCDRAPYMGKGYKPSVFTDEEKYMESFYMIPAHNGDSPKYGFISSAIKSACVDAARFIPGLHMTVVRGLFFVEEGDGLLELKHPTGGTLSPAMDCQMVIKKDGKHIPVVRARFDEWAIDFTIRWQAVLTNEDVILGILAVAGESIGLGCLRPGKSGRQMYGTFKIAEG
jgi:hypothetical protein